MQRTFSTYHSSLSKALLGLACFWSVFLFSGYVENDVFALPETVSTELIETKVKTAPIVFFQKVQAFRHLLNTQNKSYYKTAFALKNYNTQIETAFLQLQKEGFNYTFWRPFLPNQHFPISSDTDVPSFLIT